jgi:hypothetical protein
LGFRLGNGCHVEWIEFCRAHDHGEACRQEGREQEERIAESARGAPACGVPADDEQSASQYQRESQLLRGRKLLPQNGRGDQRNK